MKLQAVIAVVVGYLASSDAVTVTIQMPPVNTTKAGEYVCYAHPLDVYDQSYIVSSLIEVSSRSERVVHHVSIGVCSQPASDTNPWYCTHQHQQGQNCLGAAVNFVGWDDMIGSHDKFAPPEGVGILVGRGTEYKYLLIEVHYSGLVRDSDQSAANVTLTLQSHNPTPMLYQSYLLLNQGYIPANTEHGVFTEIACEWKKPAVFAYRYYLHTHHHGLLVEGYLVRNGSWRLLGSQLTNHQPKETYLIPGGPVKIKTGDVLTARCLYVNKNDKPLEFGLLSEMCNFNVEFGYSPDQQHHFRRPAACLARSPDFSFCDHSLTAGLC